MIAVLARHEARRLWSTGASAWVMLGALLALTGWQFFELIEAHVILQEKDELGSGLSASVVIPMFLPMALLMFLLAALGSFRGFGQEQLAGTDLSLRSTVVTPASRVVGKYLGMMPMMLCLLAYLIVLIVILASSHELDWGRILLALTGLLLLILLAQAVALMCSALVTLPMTAALMSLLLLMALWSIDRSAVSRGVTDSILSSLSLTAVYRDFLTGRFVLSGVIYLLSLTGFCLAVTWLVVRQAGVTRLASRALGFAMAGLLLVLVIVINTVAGRFDVIADVTENRRHSLAPASEAVLDQLDGEVIITAFAAPEGPLRIQLAEFLDPWLRYKADLSLQFLDPANHLNLIRELDIRSDGELLVQYRNRQDTLRQLNDRDLTQLLLRLSRQQQTYVSYASGSGEGDFRGEANFDYGYFGSAMNERGLVPGPLDLILTPVLPDNLQLLILTPARGSLLPGVTDAIIDYLETGGNLLLLMEPESTRASNGSNTDYDDLLSWLGLARLQGQVIDTGAVSAGMDNPLNIVVNRYPASTLLESFYARTLFPGAAALSANCESGSDNNAGFDCRPIVSTGPGSWTETSVVAGTIGLNEDQGEVRGPLHIGYRLTRSLDDGTEQRIVVMGDSDFITNRYYGNGGNLDFGMRLMEWLTDNDVLINVEASERNLDLNWSARTTGWLAIVFMLLLPAMVVGYGLRLGWKRRRA